MSGRFTFTAGNTLTAAQLNANVMDGIPFKIVTGEVNVTTTATATWSSGTVGVTFAASFTSGVTPIMAATVRGSEGTSPIIAQVLSVGNTGFTMRCTVYGNLAKTYTCPYIAVQMTATNGIGNS